MTGLFAKLRDNARASRSQTGSHRGSAVLAGAFQICGFAGVRFNTSPSLPVGLYVTTTDRNANLVEFCPAEPFASLAIARGYRDRGTCRDGAAPY